MNLRRRPLIASGMALMAPPCQVFAQTPDKVWRIGVLLHNLPLDGFRQGVGAALKDLGYTEGRNLQLEGRSTHGRVERLNDLATELVAAQVDLIVAPLNREIQAAIRATKTIPILMM